MCSCSCILVSFLGCVFLLVSAWRTVCFLASMRICGYVCCFRFHICVPATLDKVALLFLYSFDSFSHMLSPAHTQSYTHRATFWCNAQI